VQESSQAISKFPRIEQPANYWSVLRRSLPGGIAALAVAGLSLLGYWQPLEQIAYRVLFHLRPSNQWDKRVVVIAIDDVSLKELGHFPWPRGQYAKLLNVLSEAQPSVVVLDILFPESSPEDKQLSAAIDSHGKVVLPLAWDNTGHALFPTPALRDRAVAEGHVLNYQDSDGITRFIKPQIKGVPILGIAATQTYALTSTPVQLPNLEQPLLVNWPSSVQQVQQYSFAAVVRGQVPAVTFKDKIVIVGATATGLDSLPTPFDRNPPASGVHLQAAIVSNVLQQNFLQAPAPAWMLTIWLLGGPIFSWLVTPWRPWQHLVSWLGLCGSWGMLSWLMFQGNYWLPVASPIALFSLTAAAVALQERLKINRQLLKSQEQLQHREFYDPLTGLPNRAFFIERLESAIARARCSKDHLFAVLFLDLDRFKVVNDSLGHRLGDQLLVAIALRLTASLRPTDTVARFAGDEFTILLNHLHNFTEATQIAERIHKALTSPFQLDGQEVFTTASIGIVLSRSDLMEAVCQKDSPICPYSQPEDVLRDANIAMHQAKVLKGGYAMFNTPLHARAQALLHLETDLRRAIVKAQNHLIPRASLLEEHQEFLIHYQPIVAMSTGLVMGFEALVRWQHPQRGLVSPGEFIPLAEETGLIAALDRWVLREACRQLRTWQKQFSLRTSLTVSVNLSGVQLRQSSDLIQQIDQTLQETGLEGHCLKLEITESGLMENADAATTVLKQLRALGIQLGIDDFGTGYSSLGRLHCLPINTLKVDQSFVRRMANEGESLEIIQTIVTLAHNLGMDVVAEGIETAEQLERLKRLQCDYGQGYFFSKPVDAQKAEALIAAQLPC
jgi:diguanylate cyclase (GGDEF)-like protein